MKAPGSLDSPVENTPASRDFLVYSPPWSHDPQCIHTRESRLPGDEYTRQLVKIGSQKCCWCKIHDSWGYPVMNTLGSLLCGLFVIRKFVFTPILMLVPNRRVATSGEFTTGKLRTRSRDSLVHSPPGSHIGHQGAHNNLLKKYSKNWL
jgi:hypothetical protein